MPKVRAEEGNAEWVARSLSDRGPPSAHLTAAQRLQGRVYFRVSAPQWVAVPVGKQPMAAR